ncbi:MAG: hypothetical protein M5U14_13145 [Acidimicrobiia bacterium]|nr:hypothetical protein [Acidimicrobiia bacterium]
MPTIAAAGSRRTLAIMTAPRTRGARRWGLANAYDELLTGVPV